MPTDTQAPTKLTAKTKEKPVKPASLPPYHVLLLDDNDHSHEYVMEMLKSLFGYAPSMGYSLAEKVDRHGRAVVFTTHRELAELKCEMIGQFGNDWRVATCCGSMSAVIVKADE